MFSAISLATVVTAKQDKLVDIASIDVVCKKEKPSGRGLTTVRKSKYISLKLPELDFDLLTRFVLYIDPIKDFAERVNLPYHEIETFTGWSVSP